jgi:eukaryotic-like serine/threonine-protein kinase
LALPTCYSCEVPTNYSSQFCSHCGIQLVLRHRYRLLNVIGKGGFGIVYKAYDTQGQLECAVKVVSSVSAAEQRQVATECSILAAHSARFPFIPTIFEHWTDNLKTYIVMEFIEGKPLDQLASRGWRPEYVLDFLRSTLDHLAKLHAVDIIHRDIKPSNIMRTSQGAYVFLDFGIAKQGAATHTIAKGVGSIAYTPIEQFQGQKTDARSDIYSLGATAYHVLTGKQPVSADARRAGAPLPNPSTIVANVPRHLEDMILAMMNLEAAQRPPDAATAIAALQTVAPRSAAPPQPIPAPPSHTTRNTRSQNRTAIIVAIITGVFAIIAACFTIVGANIMDRMNPGSAPLPQPSAVAVVATNAPISDDPAPPAKTPVAPTSAPEAFPQPNTDLPDPAETPFEPLDPLPNNFQCPIRNDAGWLNVPGIWYGPFSQNGVTYALGYDVSFIYVWDSVNGMRSWNDPGVENKRNQWLNLIGTPFDVCVDRQGFVFAAFSP